MKTLPTMPWISNENAMMKKQEQITEETDTFFHHISEDEKFEY